MATTFTYTPQMSGQPKKPHSGIESIPVDMLIGGTNKVGSISDVVLLGKIPNGAVVTSIGYRPVKVSLSDDRAVQHVTLALNCTAGVSGTVSTSIYGQLRYKSDGTAL